MSTIGDSRRRRRHRPDCGQKALARPFAIDRPLWRPQTRSGELARNASPPPFASSGLMAMAAAASGDCSGLVLPFCLEHFDRRRCLNERLRARARDEKAMMPIVRRSASKMEPPGAAATTRQLVCRPTSWRVLRARLHLNARPHSSNFDVSRYRCCDARAAFQAVRAAFYFFRGSFGLLSAALISLCIRSKLQN